MRLLVLLLFLGTLFASENEILICENGTELLEWNHAFLEAAEESIEFSACFFGGKVCQDLLHAMERKLESIDHFQVHILTTPVLFSPDDYVLVDRLLKRYPDRFHLVHAYNVLTMESVGSIDNHMKLFVVDGKYYSMGGSNYSEIAITEGTNGIEKYKRIDSVIVDLPLGSRDQDLVGRGEAAKELRLIFFKMYAIWERFNAENRLWQLEI
ncbi:MAG: hypothetical protein K0U13_06820, partial [Chlamydiae bacterium]|nr:hypothetical protein [Chlamydiota bacterium]